MTDFYVQIKMLPSGAGSKALLCSALKALSLASSLTFVLGPSHDNVLRYASNTLLKSSQKVLLYLLLTRLLFNTHFSSNT